MSAVLKDYGMKRLEIIEWGMLAMARQDMSGVEVRVLLALCMFANDKGTVDDRTQRDISARSGVNRVAVNRAVKSLESKGLIEKHGLGFHVTSSYMLKVE